MLMRTTYVKQFCTLCMVETEHVEMIYADAYNRPDKKVITCQNCQDTYEVVHQEDQVRKELYTYTIASVAETDISTARRLNVVQVIKEIQNGKPGTLKKEDLLLQYPAYGVGPKAVHYPASVATYPDDKGLGHVEEKIIAKLIRTFMGIKEP
jgi:hypothetical protein